MKIIEANQVTEHISHPNCETAANKFTVMLEAKEIKSSEADMRQSIGSQQEAKLNETSSEVEKKPSDENRQQSLLDKKSSIMSSQRPEADKVTLVGSHRQSEVTKMPSLASHQKQSFENRRQSDLRPSVASRRESEAERKSSTASHRQSESQVASGKAPSIISSYEPLIESHREAGTDAEPSIVETLSIPGPSIVRQPSTRNRRTKLTFRMPFDAMSQSTQSNHRVTRMFQSILRSQPNQSVVLRPILQYEPTYRLESQNPFDARVVEDLLEKLIEARMEAHGKIQFTEELIKPLCKSISEEVLTAVKSKNYDRYRILVNVTVGEKLHQSCHQSTSYLWDAETDAFAKYVYERPGIFIITTVYGVYYD